MSQGPATASDKKVRRPRLFAIGRRPSEDESRFIPVELRLPEHELRRLGGPGSSAPQRSALHDELRVVKRHLIETIRKGAGRKPDPRIILITSASLKDGKSFVALHLGMALALDRGLRITLIDCDIDGAGLSTKLDANMLPGLMDCLDGPGIGVSRALLTTSLPNLQVMPAGSARSATGELLADPRMPQLLGELLGRGGDQLVILDSPAVLKSSDAVTLAQYAGQILFVVAANESRRSEIDDALALLHRLSAGD